MKWGHSRGPGSSGHSFWSILLLSRCFFWVAKNCKSGLEDKAGDKLGSEFPQGGSGKLIFILGLRLARVIQHLALKTVNSFQFSVWKQENHFVKETKEGEKGTSNEPDPGGTDIREWRKENFFCTARNKSLISTKDERTKIPLFPPLSRFCSRSSSSSGELMQSEECGCGKTTTTRLDGWSASPPASTQFLRQWTKILLLLWHRWDTRGEWIN